MKTQTVLSISKKLNFFSFVLIMALPGSSLIAQPVVYIGNAKGTMDLSNYPTEKIPLMQSFKFSFIEERELQAIAVQPNAPNSNTIRLSFKDNTSDDPYFYRVSHYHIANNDNTIIRRKIGYMGGQQVGDGIGVEYAEFDLDKPGEDYKFVLIGFFLGFQGDSYDIQEIGIRELNGILTLFYSDDTDDDQFLWSVDYAWVPNAKFLDSHTAAGEEVNGFDTQSLPETAGIRVLQGFHFRLKKDDHDIDIKRIGAELRPNNLRVFFSDAKTDDDDDDFDWRVFWATLKPATMSLPNHAPNIQF